MARSKSYWFRNSETGEVFDTFSPDNYKTEARYLPLSKAEGEKLHREQTVKSLRKLIGKPKRMTLRA